MDSLRTWRTLPYARIYARRTSCAPERFYWCEGSTIVIDLAIEGQLRKVASVHCDVAIKAVHQDIGREPGGGLVFTSDAFTNVHRATIILATARNNVPAVNPQSYFCQ